MCAHDAISIGHYSGLSCSVWISNCLVKILAKSMVIPQWSSLNTYCAVKILVVKKPKAAEHIWGVCNYKTIAISIYTVLLHCAISMTKTFD